MIQRHPYMLILVTIWPWVPCSLRFEKHISSPLTFISILLKCLLTSGKKYAYIKVLPSSIKISNFQKVFLGLFLVTLPSATTIDEFSCSQTSNKWNHMVCFYVYLLLFYIFFVCVIHSCVSNSFLLIAMECSILWIHYSLFIHSAVTGNLGCCQFSGITTKVAMDILIQVFCGMFSFILG